MDNIYQAIKAFFKAIINLFVAVIDLFAGLLNGIAFLFEKLKPKAAERLHSLGTEKEGAAAKESRAVKENGVTMVTEIREQLAARVKTKEQYYYEHACMQESGSGLYMIVLAILTFALFGSTMLYSQGTKLSTRVLAAVIMAALCGSLCDDHFHPQEGISQQSSQTDPGSRIQRSVKGSRGAANRGSAGDRKNGSFRTGSSRKRKDPVYF